MLDFPPPDKPESINHGAEDGFNFPGGMGFVYEAMGVHSSVINGKKQVEDIGRDEMVWCCIFGMLTGGGCFLLRPRLLLVEACRCIYPHIYTCMCLFMYTSCTDVQWNM